MPWSVVQGIGFCVGLSAWLIAAKRRKHTDLEMSRSLGSSSPGSLPVFITFGRSLIELFALSGLSKTEIREICPLNGIENLEKALQKGKGAILYTGHFGCWELLGASIAAHGIKMMTIVKRQSNRSFDKWLVRQRRKVGMQTVYRGDSLRPMVKWLNSGGTISILMDQDAGGKGVFVPFFSKKASTPPGTASLALRFNVPVLPLISYRGSGGIHKGYILSETDINPFRKSRRPDPKAIICSTAKMTRIIEKFIRRKPSNWLWLHRRHKTRPPEELSDSFIAPIISKGT